MSYIFEEGQWQLKTNAKLKSLSELTHGRRQPFYFYDLEDAIVRARKFKASGAQVHFAMKANSHPRLLRAFQAEGLGVDVVSLGEMQKALACGFSPKSVIFSGVAKDRDDLEAALAQKILQINVESFEELQALEALCQERSQAIDIALRVNIHLTAPTHKNIQTSTPESKFGLDMRQLPDVLNWLKGGRRVALKALTVHIGSQIMDVSVFETMSREMGRLYREVQAAGFPLERLDLGGGLGIDYKTTGEDDLPRLQDYLSRVLAAHQTDARILFEPGRFLVARMGVLLAKVVYVKKTVDRQFMILNAGMNCLMRPALYQAYHRILPVVPRPDSEKQTYTIVGPLCETTDTFAEDRELTKVESGDWIAIFDAGAYGAVMANTYNEYSLPEQWSWLSGHMEIS